LEGFLFIIMNENMVIQNASDQIQFKFNNYVRNNITEPAAHYINCKRCLKAEN